MAVILAGTLAVAALMPVSCSRSECGRAGAAASKDLRDDVAPEVFKAWRTTQSYYALSEIVDAYIDPRTREVTKLDVERLLGPGDDDPEGYPNAGPRLWVYYSSRRGMNAYILLVAFDEKDRVTHINWAAE